MLTRKKKVFVLVGMVLLLAATVYLNVALASPQANGDDAVNTASFFQQYRTERETTRNQEVLYLDSIIENEALDPETVETAANQKLAITANMELELTLESLIKAKGFEDAAVSIGASSKNVNVIVKSDALEQDEVAMIYDAILSETDVSADMIKIIPIE